MPQSLSAGLLLFSSQRDAIRVLLAHPGGPYFAKKDLGAWSIPKGLVNEDEDLLEAACREFKEETGYELPPRADYLPLGWVKLKSGKVVHAWGVAGEWEAGRIPCSNSFEIEWPPKSGRRQQFPEIDRAEMFPLNEARRRINHQQLPFLTRLEDLVGCNLG